MVDEAPLRTAVDTAWAIYLAMYDTAAADGRRCLLEPIYKEGWKPANWIQKGSRARG